MFRNENINIFVIDEVRWNTAASLLHSDSRSRTCLTTNRNIDQLFPFSFRHHEESAKFCINKGRDLLPPSGTISGTIFFIYSWGSICCGFDNRNHLALFTVTFLWWHGKTLFSLSAEACHRFRASIWASHLLLLVRAHAMMNELKNKI